MFGFIDKLNVSWLLVFLVDWVALKKNKFEFLLRQWSSITEKLVFMLFTQKPRVQKHWHWWNNLKLSGNPFAFSSTSWTVPLLPCLPHRWSGQDFFLSYLPRLWIDHVSSVAPLWGSLILEALPIDLPQPWLKSMSRVLPQVTKPGIILRNAALPQRTNSRTHY